MLLDWLATSVPDVACLQELKAPDEKFPVDAIREAGYEAIWHGQKSWNGVAILARGEQPEETRQGLSGDPDDTHSRYIEAEVKLNGTGMVVASLYLPNGNPVGTEKFDYKLKWMQRLEEHAARLLDEERPVVLAGDWNVVPEDRDVFSIRAAANDALVAYEQKCTHLSCAVAPQVATGQLRCPCHRGVFDLGSGRPIAGPPRRPLSRIHVRVQDGIVYATALERRTV